MSAAQATNQTVVLRDAFADGERQTQALPDSAQWFYHANGAGGSAAVATGLLVMTPPGGQSGFIVGYLTAAGSNLMLSATGQVVELTFRFAISANSGATGDRFRFGLFDSGGSRYAGADTSTITIPQYNGWRGYGVFAGDWNNSQITLRKRALNNDLLWTTAAFTSFAGNGVTSPTLANGNVYEAMLRLELTASGLVVAGRMDDDQFSAADTSAPITNFDAVAIWSRAEIGALTLREIKVVMTEAGATIAFAPQALGASNVTLADMELTGLALGEANYTSDDLVFPAFTRWASASGTELIIADTGLEAGVSLILDPAQRRALLESDYRLDTGWANLSTAVGAGEAMFPVPITNRPGPELFFFEVSTASTGDEFFLTLNGVTRQVLSNHYGDTGLDTVSSDILDLRNAGDTANVNALTIEDLLSLPVRINGVSLNQNVLGVAINLDDFGVPPGASITNFTVRSASSSSPVDFVFVAGLAPGRKTGPFRITSLSVAPEPGQVSLAWRSWPGEHYSLLTATNVADTNWSPVLPAIPNQGDLTRQVLSNQSAQPARFYRVKKSAAAAPLPMDDGYRGIWYSNEPTGDEYVYKYSGGLATYPQQHAPIAIYRPEVNKTFFVYGGTIARQATDTQRLLHMVSYFDHATGTVPRPRILLDKQTNDAHDNPVLAMDGEGYLWIFSPSHGTSRPSYIHRSRAPYSIDEFERVLVTNYSYPGVWHVPGQGFLLFHTRYATSGADGLAAIRRIYSMTSLDGRAWSAPKLLAAIELGDYEITGPGPGKLASVFDYHPQPIGLNARANIYYLETTDFGASWQTAGGQALIPPFTNASNPALIYDSRAEGRLVYLKDLNFDSQGHPVIMFLTSLGHEPGPQNGPREWKTARWSGTNWVVRPFTTSGNNYDHGSLYLESNGVWRVIAPTETGPQPYNPGGEMVLWTSSDQGANWTRVKQLTIGSLRNHTYARRPVNAHPQFYALWADGDARQPSISRLYFTDREGTQVWQLPEVMNGETASPQIAW